MEHNHYYYFYYIFQNPPKNDLDIEYEQMSDESVDITPTAQPQLPDAPLSHLPLPAQETIPQELATTPPHPPRGKASEMHPRIHTELLTTVEASPPPPPQSQYQRQRVQDPKPISPPTPEPNFQEQDYIKGRGKKFSRVYSKDGKRVRRITLDGMFRTGRQVTVEALINALQYDKRKKKLPATDKQIDAVLSRLRSKTRTESGRRDLLQTQGSERVLDFLMDRDHALSATLLVVNLSSAITNESKAAAQKIRTPEEYQLKLGLLYNETLIRKLGFVLAFSGRKSRLACCCALRNLVLLDKLFLGRVLSTEGIVSSLEDCLLLPHVLIEGSSPGNEKLRQSAASVLLALSYTLLEYNFPDIDSLPIGVSSEKMHEMQVKKESLAAIPEVLLSFLDHTSNTITLIKQQQNAWSNLPAKEQQQRRDYNCWVVKETATASAMAEEYVLLALTCWAQRGPKAVDRLRDAGAQARVEQHLRVRSLMVRESDDKMMRIYSMSGLLLSLLQQETECCYAEITTSFPSMISSFASPAAAPIVPVVPEMMFSIDPVPDVSTSSPLRPEMETPNHEVKAQQQLPETSNKRLKLRDFWNKLRSKRRTDQKANPTVESPRFEEHMDNVYVWRKEDDTLPLSTALSEEEVQDATRAGGRGPISITLFGDGGDDLEDDGAPTWESVESLGYESNDSGLITDIDGMLKSRSDSTASQAPPSPRRDDILARVPGAAAILAKSKTQSLQSSDTEAVSKVIDTLVTQLEQMERERGRLMRSMKGIQEGNNHHTSSSPKRSPILKNVTSIPALRGSPPKERHTAKAASSASVSFIMPPAPNSPKKKKELRVEQEIELQQQRWAQQRSMQEYHEQQVLKRLQQARSLRAQRAAEDLAHVKQKQILSNQAKAKQPETEVKVEESKPIDIIEESKAEEVIAEPTSPLPSQHTNDSTLSTTPCTPPAATSSPLKPRERPVPSPTAQQNTSSDDALEAMLADVILPEEDKHKKSYSKVDSSSQNTSRVTSLRLPKGFSSSFQSGNTTSSHMRRDRRLQKPFVEV
eukprot:m.105642 g.105642  ORF g.105642 m.105642 type:complete len:1039 (-) comp13885_c0_seq1:93-3209(-)